MYDKIGTLFNSVNSVESVKSVIQYNTLKLQRILYL